jgi:FAD/FMN-containing dehydrogenase
VQATGHGAVPSLAGHLLVSTRALDEITVHPQERWARVGAGVKWSELVPHVAPHGLAGVSGSSTDVASSVHHRRRRRPDDEDPRHPRRQGQGDRAGHRRRPAPPGDAARAPGAVLRPARRKGAAGIVTALEFDLIELPAFYGGSAFFDAADAPPVIAAWREWSAELPFAGTTSIAIFQLPPMPGAGAARRPDDALGPVHLDRRPGGRRALVRPAAVGGPAAA